MMHEAAVVDLGWRKACAVALSELADMGPARLAAVLSDAPPEVAWERIAQSAPLPPGVRGHGRSANDQLRHRWAKQAGKADPLELLSRYEAANIDVWTSYDGLPLRFAGDPAPPAVLFFQGRPEIGELPTVAIIGTRRATPEGRKIAYRFGQELTEAGVAVVSGLALGIDGAAHLGALAATRDVQSSSVVGPIGVVGSGLDVVYPRAHHQLWDQIACNGLLISESPMGTAPEPWRFPARNRIIAALADIVVVVESPETGGSMLTVSEAMSRDRQVMAVPGSIQSKASQGTNLLLSEGAALACTVDDILANLHHERLVQPCACPPVVDAELRSVLEAVDRSPTSTDQVVLRTGLSVAETCMLLMQLQEKDLIDGDAGWWQRVDRE